MITEREAFADKRRAERRKTLQYWKICVADTKAAT